MDALRAGSWPLVGRDDEISFAREQIVTGGSVVIAGDAGVGKTRLARELTFSAQDDGRKTEWAVATHAAHPVPLGALAHLIPSYALDGGRDATLRAVIEALHRHGDSQLVLGIDDAHLLDGVSAVLVHQLVATESASVVMTVRSGEPVPDPILGLWKDDLAVRVELQPLSRAEVAELLTAALGGPIDGAGLHALWQWSAGNLLFLRQLVLQGIERGSLRLDDKLWHWVGPLEPGPRLRDLVASRIGLLSDAERDALEVVAVGEPLPIDCLRELFSVDVITGLERRGLVRSRHEAGSVQVRLVHPLFGEVVRADAPALRIDDVRRRLADAFQANEVGHGQTLRVATWRAEIGDPSDPDVLVTGARRAWALGEVDLAERLSRLALEAGPDFDAGHILGEALADQGRFQEAVDTWLAAEDLPASDAQRATFAAGLAGILVWALGRPAEADDAVSRAAERVTDAAAQHELEVVRTFIGVISAETSGQGIEQVTAALRSPVLSERARARAAVAAVIAWTEAGRLHLAIHESANAIEVADRYSGELVATGVLLRLLRARALSLSGAFDEAQSVAAAGYASALEHDDDRSRARWCLISGAIALLHGDARGAVVRLEEGVLVLREQDDGFLRGALVYSSMSAALLGDVERAGRTLEEAERSNPSLARTWDVDFERARGWLCMARGERSAAESHALEAARTAAGREQWSFEALALHDVARFGGADRAAGRLRALAGVVDGRLVPTLASHAEGLARRDAEELDIAAATFGELGFDLYAAEAAAAAAAAHRTAGKRASAAASTNRATAWMERCEGVVTPAFARMGHDDDLTAREREVATLAARGLSDQQIADQLFVSVRTVHAHLRAAYTKLGISSRNELPAALGAEHVSD
jgi:DNA-binding CsgD family transcriptional regulator